MEVDLEEGEKKNLSPVWLGGEGRRENRQPFMIKLLTTHKGSRNSRGPCIPDGKRKATKGRGHSRYRYLEKQRLLRKKGCTNFPASSRSENKRGTGIYEDLNRKCTVGKGVGEINEASKEGVVFVSKQQGNDQFEIQALVSHLLDCPNKRTWRRGGGDLRWSDRKQKTEEAQKEQGGLVILRI